MSLQSGKQAGAMVGDDQTMCLVGSWTAGSRSCVGGRKEGRTIPPEPGCLD